METGLPRGTARPSTRPPGGFAKDPLPEGTHDAYTFVGMLVDEPVDVALDDRAAEASSSSVADGGLRPVDCL